MDDKDRISAQTSLRKLVSVASDEGSHGRTVEERTSSSALLTYLADHRGDGGEFVAFIFGASKYAIDGRDGCGTIGSERGMPAIM